MKKDSIAYYSVLSLTLAITFFLFEVLIGEISFQLLNLVPFIISAVLGAAVGLLYFQLVGYRTTRFQFLSSIVPAVVLGIIVVKSGLHESWMIDYLTIVISCLLAVSNALEKHVNTTSQTS